MLGRCWVARVGAALRRARDARGLTQTVLSDGTNITQGYLSSLETGKLVRGPTVDVLCRYAAALACDCEITLRDKQTGEIVATVRSEPLEASAAAAPGGLYAESTDKDGDMSAEDGVRLLTLLSGVVLFYSTLLQLRWQRTQAKRDAEGTQAEAPTQTNPSTTADQEANNLNEFKRIQRENALRPFFDVDAYRCFLWGFAISAISAVLDLLAHGWPKEFFSIEH